jgi:hypothetical protein
MAARDKLVKLLKVVGATSVRGKRNLKWRIPGSHLILTTPRLEEDEESREWDNCLARLRRIVQPAAPKKATKRHEREKHKTTKRPAASVGHYAGDVEGPTTFRAELAKAVGIAYGERHGELQSRYTRKIHTFHEAPASSDIPAEATPAPETNETPKSIRAHRYRRPVERAPVFKVRTYTKEQIEIANRIRLEKGDTAYRDYLNSLTEDYREAERQQREPECKNPIVETRSEGMTTIHSELKRLDQSIAGAEHRIAAEVKRLAEAEQAQTEAKERIQYYRDFLEMSKMYRSSIADHPEVIDLLNGNGTVPAPVKVVQKRGAKYQPNIEERGERKKMLMDLLETEGAVTMKTLLMKMRTRFPQISDVGVRQMLLQLEKDGSVRNYRKDGSMALIYELLEVRSNSHAQEFHAQAS